MKEKKDKERILANQSKAREMYYELAGIDPVEREKEIIILLLTLVCDLRDTVKAKHSVSRGDVAMFKLLAERLAKLPDVALQELRQETTGDPRMEEVWSMDPKG
jgi:hypothetical protein